MTNGGALGKGEKGQATTDKMATPIIVKRMHTLRSSMPFAVLGGLVPTCLTGGAIPAGLLGPHDGAAVGPPQEASLPLSRL